MQRHFSVPLLAALLLALTAPGSAVPQAPTSPIPAVVMETWSKQVGRWTADNRAYRSDAEPFDEYGLEWRFGLGRQTLVGRLFGLRGGTEVATFWEFREFWHPGDRQVVLMQFGAGGAYGVGPNDIRADGTSEMVQTFFSPAGDVSRVGHRSELSGDLHVTRSFDVTADGTWTPRRTYTWRRQPARADLGRDRRR